MAAERGKQALATLELSDAIVAIAKVSGLLFVIASMLAMGLR
jgi:hypothetical protein